MPNLLSLPAELRCQIYGDLLHDPSDWYRRFWTSANAPHPTVRVCLSEHTKPPGSAERPSDPRDVLLTLSLVNKQVHDEIEELFYPRFTFWFYHTSAEKIRTFCTPLHPKARKLICHVRYSFWVTNQTRPSASMLLRAQEACAELAARLPSLKSATVCVVFITPGLMPTDHDTRAELQDGIMNVVRPFGSVQLVSLEDVDASSRGWGSMRYQIMEECRRRLHSQTIQIGA